jgi:3-dehydroquinate synthase
LSISNVKGLIHRSIEIKNEVVTKDPKEIGLRKILNFGHTLGHAIESYFLENNSKEKLTHGEAIAIGMITESYLSEKLLGFKSEYVSEIKNEILKIYPKVKIMESDFESILAYLIHDKKNVGGEVNFVLLKNFEECQLDCKVDSELIIAAIKYYLS